MPGPKELLFGVLVPAFVCGLVLLTAWGRRSETPQRSRGRIAGALALGLGYLAAHQFLFSTPVLPSADRVLAARDWIPWVVLCVMLLALIELVAPLRRPLGVLAGPIACALIVWLSLHRQLGTSINALEIGTAFLALCAAWISAEALARRAPGAGTPLVLWVVATGTSVAALLATTASAAQVAGALAGCLGAAVVLAWWNPRLSLAGGGVAVAVVLIGACVINAVFFSTLPRACGILLLLGLVTPWLAALPWFDALGSKAKALVRAGSAALPTAAAIVLAKLTAPDSYY